MATVVGCGGGFDEGGRPQEKSRTEEESTEAGEELRCGCKRLLSAVKSANEVGDKILTLSAQIGIGIRSTMRAR